MALQRVLDKTLKLAEKLDTNIEGVSLQSQDKLRMVVAAELGVLYQLRGNNIADGPAISEVGARIQAAISALAVKVGDKKTRPTSVAPLAAGSELLSADNRPQSFEKPSQSQQSEFQGSYDEKFEVYVNQVANVRNRYHGIEREHRDMQIIQGGIRSDVAAIKDKTDSTRQELQVHKEHVESKISGEHEVIKQLKRDSIGFSTFKNHECDFSAFKTKTNADLRKLFASTPGSEVAKKQEKELVSLGARTKKLEESNTTKDTEIEEVKTQAQKLVQELEEVQRRAEEGFAVRADLADFGSLLQVHVKSVEDLSQRMKQVEGAVAALTVSPVE